MSDDRTHPSDPSPRMRAETTAVWGGELEPHAAGATQVPVFHAVNFHYAQLDDWEAVALGRAPGDIYSRNTNPTVRVFENKVAALEGAEAATAFSTGMAAISNTLFALLSPGNRVVSIKDSYGGTSRLFLDFLPRFGVQTELCATGDHEAIEKEIARGCDLLYLETPTNPTLKVLDIERLAAAAQAAGATTVVDNTFATPINQRPLELGADLVVHSATKFLGGHSDAMGGALCGSAELVERVFRHREIAGASLDANSAFLLVRGMKTLALRVQHQNRSALELAGWLAAHPAVGSVFYPGLEEHPGHEVARRQMSGFGGVLSFALADDDRSALQRMLPRLRFAHLAASLGSVGTLAGPPSVTSHVENTPEQRAALGIPETLIRFSVGIEHVDDLKADLDQALRAIAPKGD